MVGRPAPRPTACDLGQDRTIYHRGVQVGDARPLRGLGPRVFISYSFHDRPLADVIADDLRSRGMQVRMEDERSLLGRRLDEVLPARIGECEVFLLLLTETSVRSQWVMREFEWASASVPTVLPMVMPGVSVPEPIASWAYLPISAPVDATSLDLISEVALRSIAVLPLDPHAPYQFSPPELLAYCAGGQVGGQRVVLDATGILARLLQATVRHTAGAEDHIREYVTGESHRQLRRLAVLDAFLPEVLGRVLPHVERHWPSEDRPHVLARVAQRLFKLTVGKTVLDLATRWHPATRGELADVAVEAGRTAAARADSLQQLARSRDGAGHLFWALDAAPGEQWLHLGFAGTKHIAVAFPPADRVDWDVVQYGLSAPSTEVTVDDWITLCIPQAAARIMPAEVDGVPLALEGLGFSLSDYHRFGPQ